MPNPLNITKAFLQEIGWNSHGVVNYQSRNKMQIQFNPDTLKVSFSNQIKNSGQAGGSAIQFSGRGTTKLSFDLWFDVTDPNIGDLDENYKNIKDVRRITKKVAEFMNVKKEGSGENATYVPPGVRFQWGTFLFEGVMESINETLDFFSEEGNPLRANVSVSLTKQDIKVEFPESDRNGASGASPGMTPAEPARGDEPIQQSEARRGNADNWPRRALANNVENPRHIPSGTPLFEAGVNLSAALGLRIS